MGADGSRSIQDIRDSFLKWCVKRVAYLEKGACLGYSDVVTMSLTPMADAPSQGGAGEVCLLMDVYISQVKAVERDLALVEEALPKRPHSVALLSAVGSMQARWRAL